MKLPTAELLRNTPGLRWLSTRLTQRVLWVFDKKRVARGASVGLFTCWIPIPFQMLVAIPLATFARANVPVAVICVWVSNPLTWIPMTAIAYEVGYLILRPEVHYLVEINEAEDFTAMIAAVFPQALGPILMGTFILQVVCAAASYTLVTSFWEQIEKLARRSEQK